MNKIAVEVTEDARRPEGGHAVIRLRGLNVVPAPADYRIEPVDGLANVSDSSDWPLGPRKPVETRLTEQGVEIIAGPDVVESPHLLPGTPVVISVPAADVEAEILWPDVTPLARTERRPVIALPDVLAMALAQQEHGEGPLNGKAGGAAAAALQSLSALVARPAAAAASPDEPLPPLADGPTTSKVRSEADAAAKIRDRATLRRLPLRRRPGPIAEGVTEAGSHAAEAERIYPIQPYTPLPEPAPADKASPRLATIAIAVAVVAALSSILGNLLRPGGGQIAAPAAATRSAALPTVALARPAPAVSLFDVLAIGPVSPRGARSEGVSMSRALEQADVRLHGPAAGRDPAEGAFWLRHAIASSLADPRAQWALTQLGSLYAEPLQGEPDYGKARLLWEIAGGLGDPVALCFLGSLSEFGIAGNADKAAAAEWYARAKRAGGCRHLDEAIKRTKQ